MYFKTCRNLALKSKNDEAKLVMVSFSKANNGYFLSTSTDGCLMLIVLFKTNVYATTKHIYKHASEKITKVHRRVLWLIISVLLFQKSKFFIESDLCAWLAIRPVALLLKANTLLFISYEKERYHLTCLKGMWHV